MSFCIKGSKWKYTYLDTYKNILKKGNKLIIRVSREILENITYVWTVNIGVENTFDSNQGLDGVPNSLEK